MAWVIPAVVYYVLIRKLCIYIVFPGSFFGYKRRLEIQYQESMGNVVLEQIRDFRSCVEMFRSGSMNQTGSDRT